MKAPSVTQVVILVSIGCCVIACLGLGALVMTQPQVASLLWVVLVSPDVLWLASLFFFGVAVATAIWGIAQNLEVRSNLFVWRRRLNENVAPSAPSSGKRAYGHAFFENVERATEPFFRSRLGKGLGDDWRTAWHSRFRWHSLVFLGVAFILTLALGTRATGGSLVGSVLACLTVGLLIVWTHGRADDERNRFQRQLPEVLDALSRSLQAGQSLAQAIEFVASQMADPAGHEFGIMTQGIAQGRTIEQAFRILYEHWPSEDVELVIEGVKLQHKIGGNIVQMMQEIAAVIRQRVKVEQDIRNLTAQGRMSAVVTAGLVPFSTAMLWILNPKYSDILRTTFVGQILLTIAILLTISGMALIWRISMVEY
jgi:tight adherence protein B